MLQLLEPKEPSDGGKSGKKAASEAASSTRVPSDSTVVKKKGKFSNCYLCNVSPKGVKETGALNIFCALCQ